MQVNEMLQNATADDRQDPGGVIICSQISKVKKNFRYTSFFERTSDICISYHIVIALYRQWCHRQQYLPIPEYSGFTIGGWTPAANDVLASKYQYRTFNDHLAASADQIFSGPILYHAYVR